MNRCKSFHTAKKKNVEANSITCNNYCYMKLYYKNFELASHTFQCKAHHLQQVSNANHCCIAHDEVFEVFINDRFGIV